MFYPTHERHFRVFAFPGACCLLLIVISSCSVQKQIAKSAKENVLTAPALQTAHVGISIYEPAANKYWYNYQGEHYFVPASNTKIPTCYAAMKYLGDSLVGIRYARRGGQLLILPAGDPTFFHPDFLNQPVIDFLKSENPSSITWGTYTFTTTPFGSGWSWNDYDQSYMAERSAFPIHGNVVTIKDTATTIPKIYINKDMSPGAYSKGGYLVERRMRENVFEAPSSDRKFTPVDIPFITNESTINDFLKKILNAPSVYTYDPFLKEVKDYKIIHSQPTDSLLKPMMHRSDNFFAEQSLLMVCNERLGEMNETKIIDTLLKTDFKDLPQKPRWVDGSGLSRYNLFTPQDLVAILGKMKNEFGMDRIKVILPTGGEGTISTYYKTESGYIFAKTGTLSGVVAISGFLYTKKNKLLIFSILVNNHNASATDVRRAVEKFLQEIRRKF